MNTTAAKRPRPRESNMIAIVFNPEISSIDNLMSEDALLFADWVERDLIQKTEGGICRITAQGEVVFWALHEPGDRAREIALILDENIGGILADLDKSKSLAAVVALWNPSVESDGLILSELDLYRTILRWKLNPPSWFDNTIRDGVARVEIEFPAENTTTPKDDSRKVLMLDENPGQPLQTWGRKHNLTESQIPITEQQMLDRVSVLSDEMDANDEENRMMQEELDALYAKIDALK